jgi:glycine/D-amino acid oxidase-like deaminating enzyme
MRSVAQILLEEGWPSIQDQWNSHTIESYLSKMNISRATIDYWNISNNFETNIFILMLQLIRSKMDDEFDSYMYRIKGGSDLLVDSMVNDCQRIESNRCSIRYAIPINQVQLLASNQIQLTTNNNVSQVFDTVVVATTATIAQLIDFEPRIDFLQKYVAMRQVRYQCATKILLTFNVSWWYTQENITGGVLRTDLLLRSIFYPSTNSSQTDGGTILASYTSSQDSMIWQSFSEADAIKLALKLLIRIHQSSPNIRDYFQGGKVKHWCKDPYVLGAYAEPTPLPGPEVFELQSSISNIHFIGEHTSVNRGWVEGALSSAIRAALSITEREETTFDVVIIGGGPIGLMTAILLSLKRSTIHIAIVEKETIMNSDGSSGLFDQRQFSQLHIEEYLAELTNMSFSLWHQLEQMANMSFGSILNTDNGFLFFGDFNTNKSIVEDDFVSIKRTCEKRQLGCEYLNSTQLQMRYPTFSFSHQYQGIFHQQSGYINVSTLMIALLRIISQNSNIIIRQQEEFLSLKLSNQTEIITNRGTLYASRKVLFVPGPYAKNISRLLNFDLNITLWELPTYYFRLLPNATQFPTWVTWNDNDLQSHFAGFSTASTSSDYVAFSPHFIRNLSNPLIYPSQRTNTIDTLLTKKVIEWISRHMAMQVNVSNYDFSNQTCLATFLPDNGFLLDYVPRTDRRVLIQAAGWSMKFVPIWGDILSDMILLDEAMNTSSKYAKYMEYFSLSRPNRLIENITLINEGFQTVSFSFFTLVLSFHITIFV